MTIVLINLFNDSSHMYVIHSGHTHSSALLVSSSPLPPPGPHLPFISLFCCLFLLCDSLGLPRASCVGMGGELSTRVDISPMATPWTQWLPLPSSQGLKHCAHCLYHSAYHHNRPHGNVLLWSAWWGIIPFWKLDDLSLMQGLLWIWLQWWGRRKPKSKKKCFIIADSRRQVVQHSRKWWARSSLNYQTCNSIINNNF